MSRALNGTRDNLISRCFLPLRNVFCSFWEHRVIFHVYHVPGSLMSVDLCDVLDWYSSFSLLWNSFLRNPLVQLRGCSRNSTPSERNAGGERRDYNKLCWGVGFGRRRRRRAIPPCITRRPVVLGSFARDLRAESKRPPLCEDEMTCSGHYGDTNRVVIGIPEIASTPCSKADLQCRKPRKIRFAA